MKRLTKYLASGAADYNYPADCYGGNDCNDRAAKSAYRQTCVERLAAYEDTGLTPEEVLPKDKADEIALKLMRLADLESFCSYDRLRELAEADKDGRLVVLPCKVGDTVYMIERIFDIDNGVCDEICARKVIGYGGNNLNKLWLIGSGGICNVSIFVSEFGKTVFLTREEAKKALEAMKK
jgi:hypothetical protein